MQLNLFFTFHFMFWFTQHLILSRTIFSHCLLHDFLVNCYFTQLSSYFVYIFTEREQNCNELNFESVLQNVIKCEFAELMEIEV
jgi:hypothetical protein